ncbi:TetR/AcrR family transcriptional regulator [Roseimaritima sediminicola]|uniref:TetR/AcrR family transcriptional regulator n=1 Tax=Roseimaritima sediminicola TaxID=2662066 RepID=UPI0012982856|nr:TetR/AcrR family transcriptional regulator [Roseimaritima sediminicola]
MKHTDRKRADILAAAVRRFRASGYDNTSMDQIAEAAGASKRTVYNHFGSKEQMFEAIVHEMLDRTNVIVTLDYDAERSLVEQCTEIANSVMGVLRDEGYLDLARVVVSRLMVAPEYGQMIASHRNRINTVIAQWLAAADQDGRLRVPNADLAADQFLGMLMAYGFWPQLFGIEKISYSISQTDFIQQTVAMFLKGYQASEPVAASDDRGD